MNHSINPDTKIILLLGDTGVGKSSFVNCLHGITGEDQTFQRAKTSEEIDSCTKEPVLYQLKHQVFGDILLIDTPGFNDTGLEVSNVEIIKRIFVAFFNLDIKFSVNALIYFNSSGDKKIRFEKEIQMFCKFFKVDSNILSESSISLITNWNSITSKSQNKYEETIITEIKSKFNLPVVKWDNIDPVEDQVGIFLIL